MKSHQYFNMLAAVVAILFLAAASAPTTSFAATQNCPPTKAKAVKARTVTAKVAKRTAARYARVSNGRYKRQIARNQPNNLQLPICVQCSTGYVPNWGTVAASGSGTGQPNNPPVICSTCVPAWSLPATAARAPAAKTASAYPVCGVPTNCYWNTPATAGASATYTRRPRHRQLLRTTTTASLGTNAEGLLGSILAVPVQYRGICVRWMPDQRL